MAVLAAAYAEAGDFQNAVRYQKQALELVTDKEMRTLFGGLLKLYRQRQPYRVNPDIGVLFPAKG